MKIDLLTGLKVCSRCRVPQSVEAFCKNVGALDGLNTYCKKCRASINAEYRRGHLARLRTIRHKRYRKNREKHRAYAILKKYGLSLQGVVQLSQHQAGKCAGCGVLLVSLPQRKRHIDHSHVTGSVRGLLCEDCNTALGRVKDSPVTLRALADYVEAHA